MRILLILLLLLLMIPTAAFAKTEWTWREDIVPIHPGSGAYPRMIELADGTLLCGFDAAINSNKSNIWIVRSTDQGETWSEPILAGFRNGFNCANANLIQLDNGDILLAYRAIANRNGKTDARLICRISSDGGYTWKTHSTIVKTLGQGGVWEPHFVRVGDQILVFYANDSESAVGNTGYQNIEYRILQGDSWSEAVIASDGQQTRSRDGMPVVDRLSDGRYVMVVEANQFPDYVFIVQMKFSPDGLDWSEPLQTIYVPTLKGAGKKAGAPYVTVLPGDVLAVSFQTDEDATDCGDHVSTMKIIFSHDLGKTWSEPYEPFDTPDGYSAVWDGMYYTSGKLFALTSLNYAGGGIQARIADVAWDENLPN